MDNTPTRIFALDPTNKGFGYAVIELPLRLVEWGLTRIKGDKHTDAILGFEKLLPGTSMLLDVWEVTRWPVLVVLVLAWLTTLLDIGPGPNPRMRWRDRLPGALFTAAAWVAVTFGFKFYVGIVGGANPILGVVGAAIVSLALPAVHDDAPRRRTERPDGQRRNGPAHGRSTRRRLAGSQPARGGGEPRSARRDGDDAPHGRGGAVGTRQGHVPSGRGRPGCDAR